MSCAIERLHFNSHIIDTYPIIQMIGHIVARFADVLSKSYQHYTIIKESIVVKSRSNAKHAVGTIECYLKNHTLPFHKCFSILIRQIDSICHIGRFSLSLSLSHCIVLGKCFRQRVSYLVHRRIHVRIYVYFVAYLTITRRKTFNVTTTIIIYSNAIKIRKFNPNSVKLRQQSMRLD